MAKPGEYDFVPLTENSGSCGVAGINTLSVGIFQWVYTKDGKNLKKSAAVYRVKGPASKWQEINERAKELCGVWNHLCLDSKHMQKKSETI